MDKLIIDPEFRDKIPPLTEDEFSLLEENILSDGAVFSPLIVWDGTILDGHNRYEIIQKHPELTYAVHKVSFANRYEAIFVDMQTPAWQAEPDAPAEEISDWAAV